MNKLCFIAIGLLIYSCNSQQRDADDFFKHQLIDWNYSLSNVIISDIFSPPEASRIYGYCNIAAYEAALGWQEDYESFSYQLNELESLPQPKEEIYGPLAACIAFSATAQNLVYNVEKVKAYESRFLNDIKTTGLSNSVVKASVAYGRELGAAISEWAKTDGYIERQAMPRHILTREPGTWMPTPPDYIPGIEPNWYMIRPFALDSATQYCPPPPTPFDSTKGSDFYQNAMEVYEAVNRADNEEAAIANFWDCNPNASHPSGHAVIFTQKITPGGHWISIAGIASKKENLSFEQICEAHALASIALHDAFISCWEAKYSNNVVRPVTYINRYIDADWRPLLQTPPFPDYTSGHSVISKAAAIVLTEVIGDSVAYNDTTEVRFGLPERYYNSFMEAANEASDSRLYGGIHYRPATQNGSMQGKKIGEYVLSSLRTRKNESIASTKAAY